jgi:glutathione peroxidase-family protein
VAEDGAMLPIDHPCNAAVLAGIGTSAMSTSIERIPVKAIDGTPSSLSAYAGKVRLIVNVGNVVERFSPDLPPESNVIISAIEPPLA